MSRSNPMHHGAPLARAPRPPAPRPWPFPARLLDYPLAAPLERAPRPPAPDLTTVPPAPY